MSNFEGEKILFSTEHHYINWFIESINLSYFAESPVHSCSSDEINEKYYEIMQSKLDTIQFNYHN